jgi:hypothetical protein
MPINSTNAGWALRIVWLALLLVQAVFLIIAVRVAARGAVAPAGTWPLFLGACIAAPVAIAVGIFARMQTYKKHWREDAITPKGYLAGNLLLLIVLHIAAVFILIVTIRAGRLFPYLTPMALLLAAHLINYPHGRPMRSHPPAQVRS